MNLKAKIMQLDNEVSNLEKNELQLSKKMRDFCVVPRTAEQLKNYKKLVSSNYENEITFDELLQELSNNENEMYFDEPLRCNFFQNQMK